MCLGENVTYVLEHSLAQRCHDAGGATLGGRTQIKSTQNGLNPGTQNDDATRVGVENYLVSRLTNTGLFSKRRASLWLKAPNKSMRPTFWKVSHGTSFFSYEAVLDALSERLVYVHKDTKAKATSLRTQAEDFIHAPIGGYFYLTHGNTGVYVLGQFSGAANVFCKMGDGWLDRPYRPIKSAVSRDSYIGPHKWWSPNDNSTFTLVPDDELSLFEEHILKPYFGITLANFAIT